MARALKIDGGDALLLGQFLTFRLTAMSTDLPRVPELCREHGEEQYHCGEDEALVQQIPNDPQLFLTLYRRYYERILNYLYRRCYCQDIAEELTAQTFFAALESLRQGTPVRHFRPWLYRIATNLFFHQKRRQQSFLKRLTALWQPPEVVPLDAIMIAAEEVRRVRQALEHIPEKYRAVLVLRFDEELEYQEIAEILGRAEGTLRSQVSRGLHLLQRQLREKGYPHGTR